MTSWSSLNPFAGEQDGNWNLWDYVPLTAGPRFVAGASDVGTPKGAVSAVTNAAKSPGYDTAAQGAKDAQAYLQQLSQTAWDRQMQGLQGALGQFQGYDALKAQLIPSHANPGGGMPGGPGAGPLPGGGQQQPSGPPLTGSTGYISPRTPTSISGAPAPPIATTGYSSPRTPTSIPSNGPPVLPPPMPPPALPPPGAPPSLAPPGAPPVLGPPGGGAPGAVTPDILTMLSAMTRGGRGHF